MSERMLSADSGPITAEWGVDQTITRYPSTGPVFLQDGGLQVARARPLQLGLTVGQYATAGGLALEALLGLLNAAARAEQFAERTSSGTRSEGDRSGWRERAPPVGSLGYTGTYYERSGEVIDVSVISVLEARGPE